MPHIVILLLDFLFINSIWLLFLISFFYITFVVKFNYLLWN